MVKLYILNNTKVMKKPQRVMNFEKDTIMPKFCV